MGLRISSQEDVVCLFDSTVGQAFGPVFEGNDAEEQAELFVQWYAITFPKGDLRSDWFVGGVGLMMERFGRWHRATHLESTGEFNQSIAESMLKDVARG